MTYKDVAAETLFEDLCRQRQSEVDRALVESAHTGFQAPIFFRRIQYATCGQAVSVATWQAVKVTPDPTNKHVYLLPPVSTTWLPSTATVSHIIKLERLEEDRRRDELLTIAPFIAHEQDYEDETVKILVTASSLVEAGDSEKQPVAKYKHDNFVLNIESSFFEKPASWSLSCLNANIFRWVTGRPSEGYIKI
ncbi:hypothetical protein P389DRAFT_189597 [Cystobasidium minutum MCA 4210]|uniref:uncharacterized protein n=1 Tax=Cystobasidium minutum MCA 4210 TaxID=1397322 RepID=UPI0034CEF40A|eukprot:jgi/Rhomi1/189597/estExt_fgenesh1_pg.C_4_t10186